jgi:nicotinamide riboside kinase
MAGDGKHCRIGLQPALRQVYCGQPASPAQQPALPFPPSMSSSSGCAIYVTTGAESSGKTTLARALAKALQAPLVLEASRDYLNALYARKPGAQYTQQDLLEIARLQLLREQEALRQQPAQLVCDTDLLVIVIWSEVKYGHCDAALLQLFEQSLQQAPRHYLLCDPGIPWEPDPLREHPHAREQLYQRYLQRLQDLGLQFSIMRGSPEERLQQALAPDSRNLTP